MAAITSWLFLLIALLLRISPECFSIPLASWNTCFDPQNDPVNLFLAATYRNVSFGKRVGAPLIPCTNSQPLPPSSKAAYQFFGRSIEVNDVELWNLLHNASYDGLCSLVFFHAKWCPFSAKAAAKVNALGRMFPSLPVVAIDLAEYDWVSVDYVIAYYPSIALFYKSKVAKRFDPSASTEAIGTLLFNVTGIIPTYEAGAVDDTGPLSTTPSSTPNLVLLSAIAYLALLTLFFITKHIVGWTT